MFLNDNKQKWEKLQSKEGVGIRMYLDPYMKKHEEPERVKTHWDFMLDEVEYMNIDFREERKLKKALCTRFAHEIADVAGSSTHKKELKESRMKIISMQMASMIQSTFRKVEKNHIIPISPIIATWAFQTLR